MDVNGVPQPEERGEPTSWKCVYLLCRSPPNFDIASPTVIGKQKGAILSHIFKILQGCLIARGVQEAPSYTAKKLGLGLVLHTSVLINLGWPIKICL